MLLSSWYVKNIVLQLGGFQLVKKGLLCLLYASGYFLEGHPCIEWKF
jgi:hypothetical protein